MRSISTRRLVVALVGAATVRAAVAQTQPTPIPPPRTPPSSAPRATAPPASTATPSAQAKSDGKALLARIVQAYGGKERVAGVHDLRTRGEVSAKTPQGDMNMELQSFIVFPDRISQQVDAPFGRVVMVATPGSAFVAGPAGSQDLPDSMRNELIRQVQRIPIFLAQKADDPSLAVWASGGEKVGDVETKVVEVRYNTVAVRWFVDPKTGRILRAAHTATTPQGEASIVADYSDFKPVDGFPVAFHMEVTTNGEKDQILTLEECKINAGVEPKLFEKPPAATPAPVQTPAPE